MPPPRSVPARSAVVGEASDANVPTLQMGDWVRVRASVQEPRFKWGNVLHSDVGRIVRLDDDGDVFVNFSNRVAHWRGRQEEMEKSMSF